jgi:hypothetical protein
MSTQCGQRPKTSADRLLLPADADNIVAAAQASNVFQ